MTLDSRFASDQITESFFKITGIGADSKPDGRGDSMEDYPKLFAEAYQKYAERGIVLGAENSESDASILEAALGRNISVNDLATAFANYWSTVAVVPGVPAHGGMRVISVINDAVAKIPLFRAAIRSSITSTESKPYFFNFINNIETIAVSNIVWTVTELMPGSPPSPSPFPELIT